MQKNLTQGSVFQNIIYFSLPYLLSYFLQTLYGMADLFIVGQFNGVDSITAVSIGSQVMHMLTVMIVGLAMGATVTIGKAIGARQPMGCLAPIALPMVTVAPIARPTIITVSICITWLPIETAVILSTPLNWPTINKSAMPYRVCRK